MLPLGDVAHNEAADPHSLVHAEVTVGTEGVVREISVAWGTWNYRVTYSELGATPAPKAPAHPRPLGRG